MKYYICSPCNSAFCDFAYDWEKLLPVFAKQVVNNFKDPALWWVRVVCFNFNNVLLFRLDEYGLVKSVDAEKK